MYELELWNQRRHELVRETENERLTWSLRTTRSKRSARFGSALPGDPAGRGRQPGMRPNS
jgi:hypothetical protein